MGLQAADLDQVEHLDLRPLWKCIQRHLALAASICALISAPGTLRKTRVRWPAILKSYYPYSSIWALFHIIVPEVDLNVAVVA